MKTDNYLYNMKNINRLGEWQKIIEETLQIDI